MRSTRLPHLLLLGTAALGSGCAIVQSRPPAESSTGIAYMLPKALLPIELIETNAGALLLRVKAAELIGDPRQRFVLQAPANPFSGDDVKIEVDPATGLLKQVTASSEDQSLAALKELVSAARGIRRAELDAQGETVLYAGLFDPDAADAKDTAAQGRNSKTLTALDKALAAKVDQWRSDCTPAGGAAKVDPARCDDAKQRSVDRLRKPGTNQVAGVTLNATPLVPSAAPATSGDDGQKSAPAPDCSLGLCHRAVQPFQVDLAIDGVFAQSTVMLLPNQAAVLALPLDRAPFVKTEHTVVLSNGILQSHQAKRPSSALALVKWPLDVYKGVLEATASLIQLRIGANTGEVNMAQSQLDTAKDLQRIREELEALKSKKKGELTALGGTAAQVLTQELGRSSRQPGGTGQTVDAAAAAPPLAAPANGAATTCLPGQAAQPGQPCAPVR